MTSVAVIAHRRKSLGGGLPELRRLLSDRGVDDPIWFEVEKSRKAPVKAIRAVEEGADLMLIWGGDGTVQRCIDAVAGSSVAVAVIPAGTANLLAHNLGIPADLPAAVDVALHGARRRLDLGLINGEHFAVMGGCGFDALMMKGTDSDLKDRLGQLAYVFGPDPSYLGKTGEDVNQDRRRAVVQGKSELFAAREYGHAHGRSDRFRRRPARRWATRSRSGDCKRTSPMDQGPGASGNRAS